jgi:lipopolysaccharide/colanic/teichoic acid biosynthesis glycosyltransferase
VARRNQTLKRLLDIVGASAGLVAFAPVMAATAAAVRISMGSPVLFKQIRPGLRGELFTILKFRTMDMRPGLSDEARLTKVGRFLRSTSVDELPQLWNVLRGDMSLVGPRALLVEYLPLYSARHARRHDVKPGLTTWNAVNGRNSLTWEEQFEMDIWYVENESLLLDLKIIALTVGAVLKREGVTQEGRATRDSFRGLGSSHASTSPVGDHEARQRSMN